MLDVNSMLAGLIGDYHTSMHKAEEARAKADPVKYKNTRLFDAGKKHYNYYAAPKVRGRIIRFCWSTNRNVAGYYLTWREVIRPGKGYGKRDMFVASKVKRRCKERALKRLNALRKRRDVVA